MDQSALPAVGVIAESERLPSFRRRKDKPRPVPETPSLTKEQGVWVLYTGEPLPACADELSAQIREEREKTNV